MEETAQQRLGQWLAGHLPGRAGALTVEPIAGGQSNPTFFVTLGEQRMVLRKQPPNVMPSAHAIDREYRVMGALAASGIPVPTMLAYCEDRDILGTPFYVMERVEGRVFSECWLPGVSADDRRAMYLDMARVLAHLHSVDWAALGLADFGRQGHYFERQVSRWAKQWHLSKVADSPDIDLLLDWLPAHIPAEDITTIAHGDFRIGNLMFHPTEPRVVAVLDWELSTLGHPLADLAYSALGWHLRPDEYMGMMGMENEAPGIPDEATYLEAYYQAAPAMPPVLPFHYAFSLFRLAVIFEGISARARSGAANSANAADVGKLAASFARRAVEHALRSPSC